MLHLNHFVDSALLNFFMITVLFFPSLPSVWLWFLQCHWRWGFVFLCWLLCGLYCCLRPFPLEGLVTWKLCRAGVQIRPVNCVTVKVWRSRLLLSCPCQLAEDLPSWRPKSAMSGWPALLEDWAQPASWVPRYRHGLQALGLPGKHKNCQTR